MNAIIYCRVSSDEQSFNTSLDYQEQRLREYSSQHGYTVIMCQKEDHSAKSHELDRPKLKEIYSYCRKRKNQVQQILFLRWDRFTRNVEFGMKYKRLFEECGTAINSIENHIDFNSPDWSTIMAMYCGTAQSENAKIAKRTKDGIRATLLKGKCANKAPRGYKNVRTSKHSTHIEVDEKVAPIIKSIFKELARGIKSAGYIRRDISRKYGYKIPESSFFDLLRNKFYIGKIRIPAFKDEPEHYIDGEQPALIDEATF